MHLSAHLYFKRKAGFYSSCHLHNLYFAHEIPDPGVNFPRKKHKKRFPRLTRRAAWGEEPGLSRCCGPRCPSVPMSQVSPALRPEHAGICLQAFAPAASCSGKCTFETRLMFEVAPPLTSLRTLFQPAVLCSLTDIINFFPSPLSYEHTTISPMFHGKDFFFFFFKQPALSLLALLPVLAPLDCKSPKRWLHVLPGISLLLFS